MNGRTGSGVHGTGDPLCRRAAEPGVAARDAGGGTWAAQGVGTTPAKQGAVITASRCWDQPRIPDWSSSSASAVSHVADTRPDVSGIIDMPEAAAQERIILALRPFRKGPVTVRNVLEYLLGRAGFP